MNMLNFVSVIDAFCMSELAHVPDSVFLYQIYFVFTSNSSDGLKNCLKATTCSPGTFEIFDADLPYSRFHEAPTIEINEENYSPLNSCLIV